MWSIGGKHILGDFTNARNYKSNMGYDSSNYLRSNSIPYDMNKNKRFNDITYDI
jgi:hypothetical protein